MSQRRYLATHPWISFEYQAKLDKVWSLLGEAYSKSQHLAGTPLQPGLAAQLGTMYLVKGAHATTAIEGNTLSEEQVQAILDRQLEMPPSRKYQEQAVRNVAEALHAIRNAAMSGETFSVSTDWIRDQNELVLRNLEVESFVVPGQYRETSVGAGPYLAAPAEDVPYLMECLETWLNEAWLTSTPDASTPPEQRFFRAFFAAVLGHLYVAWIHPFGDGNGRTARLLEAAVLAHSGTVPWVSCNLLSDHYNRTRDEYYRRLQAASREGDVEGFITYAAQGYVDGLREQIARVQSEQRKVAWVNYVHERMGNEPKGETRDRRRLVALSLDDERPTPKSRVKTLSTELLAMYFDKSDKTLTRDLNRLRDLGLVEATPNGWIGAVHQLDAFLPVPVQGARRSRILVTVAATPDEDADGDVAPSRVPSPQPLQPSLLEAD